MKKIFLIALAAIGMTACMQDEVMDIPTGGAITFDKAFVGNATKAVVTTDNLEAFQVWGYVKQPSGKLFEGTKVTKEGDAWTYQGTQYWAPENEYHFAAIAPVSTQWALSAYPGTLTFTNDGATDLIYAAKQVTSAAAGNTNAAVAFEFDHLLSKVKLTFTNGFPTENVTVALTEIKMATPETAKMAIASGEACVWANFGANMDFTFANQELASAASATTEEYFILPYDAVISFKVNVLVGDQPVYTGEKTATLPAATFEMGRAYNLSAVINADVLNFDEIKFTVNQVDAWVEAPNDSDEAANLAYAAQVGGTYTLTKDVTVNAPIEVKKGVDFVLDLNGKTITAELKQEGRHHYAIDNYGTLTLKNGTINARGVENFGTMVIEEGVTITNIDTNGGSAIWNEGDLVINGGTFTTNAEAGVGSYGSALNTQKGGTAVVNGGNFVANSQLTYAICNDGETVINNATVVGKHGAVAAAEGAEIKTVINGGSFSLNANPAVSDHCVYYVSEIKGGTFTLGANTDSGAQVFCESNIAAGYIAVAEGEEYTVIAGKTTASKDEFTAALQDSEVSNINLTTDLTYAITESININKDLTIYGNENDIVAGGGTSKSSSISVNGDYNVTVSDANITGGSIMLYYGADVILDNVDLTYNFDQSGRNMIYAASDNDEKVEVVIDGGTYTMTGGSGNRYVCAHGNATVYIKGGIFTGKPSGSSYAPFEAINIGTYTAQIIISGGTFNFDPSKESLGTGTTVYPPTATIADGYKVVDNGNGTWSVVAE